MKIDIQNKTHWRSDQIRAFVSHLMPEERPDLCKHGAPKMMVSVGYTRGRGRSRSSGYAYIKRNFIHVRLPKQTTPDKIDFAMVIAHELAHTRGATDEYQMRHSARYGRVGSWRTIHGWAENLPLEIAAKPPSRRSVLQMKLFHAETMLKAAMTREKRAKTIRSKWQHKVAYYSKKSAVLPEQEKS